MNKLSHIKLVASDLDGTLLCDDKTISKDDIRSLLHLGDLDILRVAATGRSMHKVHEVLRSDFPFDYIVFSSGSGVYDWKRKEICSFEVFDPETVVDICNYLLKMDQNFFVFQPIPHNNQFCFSQGNTYCHEFAAYIERHLKDCSPLDTENLPYASGQILCIIPNEEGLFNLIKSRIESIFCNIKVIRTTSPVNDQFIWLEIFPNTVSKGHGIDWICRKHTIEKDETAALGNDYNDIDLLEYVYRSYVVANAPHSLRTQFARIAASNNESAFTKMIYELGIKLP